MLPRRWQLRLWGAAIALLFAAAAATAPGYLERASAGPPPPPRVLFTIPSRQPVEGQAFAGLSIFNLTNTLNSVHCDAQIGAKRLAARKEFFFIPGNKTRLAVVCSWQIPAGAGGKRLRLWDYKSSGNRAVVTVGQATPSESPALSWIVKK